MVAMCSVIHKIISIDVKKFRLCDAVVTCLTLLKSDIILMDIIVQLSETNKIRLIYSWDKRVK